jgi:DamX protein
MQRKDEHFFEDDDRSRLLEAIEQQAKSLSMARGSEQHRLSDWLNAAEEVMPEVKKPAVKPMSLSNSNESKSNTAQIMGFLLAGTLVLSMAGGGGFAYMQLTQQISLLEKEAKSMGARVGDLEKALQESEQKIALLTTKSSSNDGTTIVTQEENKTTTDNSSKSSLQQLETLLDTRFKQMIDALDNRLQGNKTAMNNAQQSVVTQSASPAVPNINNPAIAPPSVSIPAVPQIVEVKLPSSTDSNATGDMHQEWLKSLPSEHFVLQLGSSTKASDLSQQGAKIRKNPEMAHVISVKANGSTRYILVYGDFATREEAKQSADDIKNEIGITPWVRRAGDVRQLLGNH